MTIHQDTATRLSEIATVFDGAARSAASYLQSFGDPATPVARFLSPVELQRTLSLSLPEQGRPLASLLGDMDAVLDLSVRTGHRRFFNQLFGGADAAAILGEWVAALINTSMYTYEVAPVATLIEKALIDRMASMVGFHEGEGIFIPGGSLANLMAVLAARHAHFPHAKERGLLRDDRPVMFLSSEAHYSVRRAASVAGMGLDAAVDVATDELGRMRPLALERAVRAALDAGRRPFLVVATAGTTVPGAFDPLDEITDIAARHGMWVHVDASYGGSVLFSERHRHLVAGIERADSVTWNPHKMMGVPLTCSAILLRERGMLVATNGMEADYLFHGQEHSSWDLGDMTLQCGRRVDALKLWFSWQVTGEQGYARRIDEMFELASTFKDLIEERDGFHLVREPLGTNVCFRFLPTRGRGLDDSARSRIEHETTISVRERMLREGRFLVNYATLDDVATLRLVVNNPRANVDDFISLLDVIEEYGEETVAT